ncbi:Uncharacterised protein [Vibrio cholerae]|nr:Uncharacterised protein [Vibrio cholerae]CSC43461.1 Uncharacterised protein [Vibrio cholerae]
MIAQIETGNTVSTANTCNGKPDFSAAMTTSPEVGERMIAAGEAHTATAAGREMPIAVIIGNKVAINNTPRPVAELTARDIKQATR